MFKKKLIESQKTFFKNPTRTSRDENYNFLKTHGMGLMAN